MILIGQWRDDLPPARQSRLEDARDRGFDPEGVMDPAPAHTPLAGPWLCGVEALSHRLRDDDPLCGEKCHECAEPICNLTGPAHLDRCDLHPTCEGCADQDVACPACKGVLADVADDARAERWEDR